MLSLHTASASDASPLPRRRGPETAERILDAAEDCFARKGYAGTTLRDVADRVGIRIPSLYNHFPNKGALYSAVLERGISPVLDLLSVTIEESQQGYPDPTRTIGGVMEWLAQHPNLPRLVQYELLAGGEQLAPLLGDWLQPAIARSLEVLETTPAVDRWRPDQIPYLLLAFFNIVVGHFTTSALTESLTPIPPLSKQGTLAAAQFYGQLVEVLLHDAPLLQNSTED